MDKVYIVLYKYVESGSEDHFEVKKVFKDKHAADEYCSDLRSSVDIDENEDNGIGEEYWVEAKEIN